MAQAGKKERSTRAPTKETSDGVRQAAGDGDGRSAGGASEASYSLAVVDRGGGDSDEEVVEDVGAEGIGAGGGREESSPVEGGRSEGESGRSEGGQGETEGDEAAEDNQSLAYVQSLFGGEGATGGGGVDNDRVAQEEVEGSLAIREEVGGSPKKEEERDRKLLRIIDMKNNPKMLRYYTSFRDYSHFCYFFHILGPATGHLKYSSRDLDPKDELFLTLIKLRTDKDDMELSFLFGVGLKTVGSTFRTWINFMFYQLKELNLWLPRKIVDMYMPSDFKKKFPSTRVIVDGTEIPIERPSSVPAQAASWSSYKNKNTLKVLVGISPKGAVTFVSNAYGGSASDRQIVERSDLLREKKFEKKDSIMADKGFVVQDLFCHQEVKVNMPTFLKNVNQLPPEKVSQDQRISSKRIHVERMIGAAKIFKILHHRLNHNYVALGGRILFVCLVIQNFKPCIVD